MSMTILWIVFNVTVFILLAFDLYRHRSSHAHTIELKEALWTTAFWISLALGFNVFIYFYMGPQKAVQFLTAYLVEESLSVDNLFVFALIFESFKVPELYRHQVLFWGILGAVILRAVFILVGVALVQKFHWLFYILGAILIYSGIKLFSKKDELVDPSDNWAVHLFRKFFPVTESFHNGHFFVKQAGKWMATPLFLVLLSVELVDVVFALDSIPAVLGITTDPFIAYSSNILAIMGLRSLYFVLAHSLKLLHYLHYALAAILVFIGLKMLLSDFIHLPISLSLGFVVVALTLAAVASLIWKKNEDSGTKHHRD